MNSKDISILDGKSNKLQSKMKDVTEVSLRRKHSLL